MGFSDSLAGIALDKYKNVAGAIDGLINGEGKGEDGKDCYIVYSGRSRI